MDELTKTQFAAFYPHEVFHDILWPGPPTSENLAKSKNRQLAWMAADGHSTYLKVTDTGTGEIVAGAKWCVYDKDPNRSAVLTVDWYGDEGSEDRAYAQYLIDEFNGRRTERMKGSYCCMWSRPQTIHILTMRAILPPTDIPHRLSTRHMFLQSNAPPPRRRRTTRKMGLRPRRRDGCSGLC